MIVCKGTYNKEDGERRMLGITGGIDNVNYLSRETKHSEAVRNAWFGWTQTPEIPQATPHKAASTSPTQPTSPHLSLDSPQPRNPAV